MIEQSKPPSTAINTVKTMRNLLHYASDVTIIACFTGQDDPALEVFQNAGQSISVVSILFRLWPIFVPKQIMWLNKVLREN